MSSFTRKKIDLKITLGEGQFGESLGPTVVLTGLRVRADIAKAGGVSMNASTVRVFGITQSMMNQLSTLGMIAKLQGKNSLSVFAGDDSGMSLVFEGTIRTAWADYQAAPEVAFNMEAYSGGLAAIKPVPAASYKGGIDVATIMAANAATMGVAFENNGVAVQLSNPNFSGTAKAQVDAAAKAAGINYSIDDGTLAIWPAGGFRSGDIPLLSPDSGMVGYPTFNAQGLDLVTLFNPAIKFGGQVKVQSSLPQACGTWNVFALAHNLESELPGGQWFTRLSVSEQQYAFAR